MTALPNTINYSKKVVLLILLISLIKVIVAGSLQLGTDESYYWLYAQKLQINYFDHPPIVAIWVRIFTANLFFQNSEIGLRIGSIIAGGFATWFMYKAIAEVHSSKAGWYGACLYSCSLYAAVSAGLLIMPDAPQMFFYTLSLWMIALVYKNPHRYLYWLLFGITAGLCVMSKVHGIFLWVGVGLFVLVHQRDWLKLFPMYLSAFVSLIIISPIFIWNFLNDFVTYKFHSNRVVIEDHGINWMGFVQEIIGELIINNPVNVVLIFLAIFAFKKMDVLKKETVRIFNYIGLSLLITILFIALFRQTLPHWSGVAYVALIPSAAIYLSNKVDKFFPASLKISFSYLLFVLISIVVIINFYPGNFTGGDKENFGKGDLSVDNYSWSQAAPIISKLYTEQIAVNKLSPKTPMVCNKWWGAHQEYYFCFPYNITMIGLGEVNELHQYTWLNYVRKYQVDMSAAFCVVPSTDRYDVKEAYKNYYNQIDTISVIEINRSGKPAHYFTLFRLSGWKNNLPQIK